MPPIDTILNPIQQTDVIGAVKDPIEDIRDSDAIDGDLKAKIFKAIFAPVTKGQKANFSVKYPNAQQIVANQQEFMRGAAYFSMSTNEKNAMQLSAKLQDTENRFGPEFVEMDDDLLAEMFPTLKNDIGKLRVAGILDSLIFLRKIVLHPAPQNRTTGYAESSRPGILHLQSGEEVQGLLNLTVRADQAITKNDVITFFEAVTNDLTKANRPAEEINSNIVYDQLLALAKKNNVNDTFVNGIPQELRQLVVDNKIPIKALSLLDSNEIPSYVPVAGMIDKGILKFEEYRALPPEEKHLVKRFISYPNIPAQAFAQLKKIGPDLDKVSDKELKDIVKAYEDPSLTRDAASELPEILKFIIDTKKKAEEENKRDPFLDCPEDVSVIAYAKELIIESKKDSLLFYTSRNVSLISLKFNKGLAEDKCVLQYIPEERKSFARFQVAFFDICIKALGDKESMPVADIFSNADNIQQVGECFDFENPSQEKFLKAQLSVFDVSVLALPESENVFNDIRLISFRLAGDKARKSINGILSHLNDDTAKDFNGKHKAECIRLVQNYKLGAEENSMWLVPLNNKALTNKSDYVQFLFDSKITKIFSPKDFDKLLADPTSLKVLLKSNNIRLLYQDQLFALFRHISDNPKIKQKLLNENREKPVHEWAAQKRKGNSRWSEIIEAMKNALLAGVTTEYGYSLSDETCKNNLIALYASPQAHEILGTHASKWGFGSSDTSIYLRDLSDVNLTDVQKNHIIHAIKTRVAESAPKP